MTASDTISHPELPPALLERYGVDGLALHPFAADPDALDVDFGEPRPVVLSSVILNCARDAAGRRLAPDFVEDLTIGKRLECLLRIVALTPHGRRPTFRRRCDGPDCDAWLEIELPMATLLEAQAARGTTESVSLTLGDRDVAVRLPTGRDQLRWAAEPATPASAAAALVEPPDAAREMSAAAVRDIEAALADASPLVDCRLRSACPDCDRDIELPVDLEATLLGRLRRVQDELLAAVHRLARGYHWSEREILGLPAWRRAHYLERLDRESV